MGFINQNADDQSVILLKNTEVIAPVEYYISKDKKVLAAFRNIPVESSADFNDLETQTAYFKKVYLFDYLVEITDPNRLTEAKLGEMGFSKRAEYDFRGVGFITLYERLY